MEKVKLCRVSGQPVKPLWELGSFYIPGYVKKETPKNAVKIPLGLSQGKVLQLSHRADDLFRGEYFYESSKNESMVAALRDVAREVQKIKYVEYGDVVVDIGANDGTLLRQYRRNKALYKVAFEPSKSFTIGDIDLFINDKFELKHYPLDLAKAKIVTAIAMFYDVENPHQFIEDVENILDDDGIFVIQMMDLANMIKTNDFMNICHEHEIYYSLQDLIDLFAKHRLKIFHVSHNDTNGGSIRVFAAFNRKEKYSVFDALQKEKETLDGDYIAEFRRRVDVNKLKLMDFLYRQIVEKGKNVQAIGASTKAFTLTQYYDLDNTLIPYVGEVNPRKFGKKMVGAEIEIIPELDVLQMRPDYLLIFPWHFKEMMLKKFSGYRNSGGKLIFPLPYPHIIGKGDAVWTL